MTLKRTGMPPRSASFGPRSKPLGARVAGLPRSAPIKARNAARAAKTYARAYGGKRRADWLTSQPCIVPCCLGWPTVQAHTSGDNGAGYKSSARFVVPMCQYHHDESHRGVASFEARHRLSLAACAERTEAEWLAHVAGRAAA